MLVELVVFNVGMNHRLLYLIHYISLIVSGLLLTFRAPQSPERRVVKGHLEEGQ